jgi:hypothetical protein
MAPALAPAAGAATSAVAAGAAAAAAVAIELYVVGNGPSIPAAATGVAAQGTTWSENTLAKRQLAPFGDGELDEAAAAAAEW